VHRQRTVGGGRYGRAHGCLLAGSGTEQAAHPAYLAQLVPFARATGGGSFYALWKVDDRVDLADLPVIAFGDEGGQHPVAVNLHDFFRLLAFDAEVSADWDEAYYFRNEDDEHSPGHDAYVAWLGAEFGLTRPEDPAPIVAAATERYGPRFAEWHERYQPS
jgi:hypothetical protein